MSKYVTLLKQMFPVKKKKKKKGKKKKKKKGKKKSIVTLRYH